MERFHSLLSVLLHTNNQSSNTGKTPEFQHLSAPPQLPPQQPPNHELHRFGIFRDNPSPLQQLQQRNRFLQTFQTIPANCSINSGFQEDKNEGIKFGSFQWDPSVAYPTPDLQSPHVPGTATPDLTPTHSTPDPILTPDPIPTLKPQTSENGKLRSKRSDSSLSTPSHVGIQIIDKSIFRFYPSSKLPSFTHLFSSQTHLAALNYRTRLPDWVSERLTLHTVCGSGDRSACSFYPNPTVPEIWRVTNEDYRYSGFDRGHLAAAASHRNSQEAITATFDLSTNILPQTRACNIGAWFQLERASRSLLNDYKTVFVISGPLWISNNQFNLAETGTPGFFQCLKTDRPASHCISVLMNHWKSFFAQRHSRNDSININIIGKVGVPVPTHLFKIIFAVDPRRTAAVASSVANNQPTNIETNKETNSNSIGSNQPANTNRNSRPTNRTTSNSLPAVLLGVFVVPNDNSQTSVWDAMRPLKFVEKFSGLDFSGLLEVGVDLCVREFRTEKKSVDISQLIGGGEHIARVAETMKFEAFKQ